MIRLLFRRLILYGYVTTFIQASTPQMQLPIFDTLIKQFLKDMPESIDRPYNLSELQPIQYVYLEEPILGKCGYTLTGRIIKINRSLIIMSMLFKAVVYHELTHCLYDLDHEHGTGHIMSEYIVDDEGYWRRNWLKERAELKKYIEDAVKDNGTPESGQGGPPPPNPRPF